MYFPLSLSPSLPLPLGNTSAVTLHASVTLAALLLIEHWFPGVERDGGGPAGGGCASGSGVLVSAVQLYLLSGVEDEESGGVGEQQPEAV